ncbi:MAG TPA: quinone-dependent dihydroorotate dehydrogenase [Candidatus Limnocylindrales bacterium]|nr:quinone-dependent dihydroorotate dehydrogenase [Candidatus Limnocylindrales bacterium]
MSAWRVAAYRAVRPILFGADPEGIHHATLAALRIAGRSAPGRALCRLASGISSRESASAPFDLMGMRVRNRVGLAAGFDKDGLAIEGWAALGFGFVELGTVTPRPQPGNPGPRLFRLPADEALINRMGFNNLGAEALAGRISDARPSLPDGFVIGVNIGRNRDTPDEAALDDYVAAARTVADAADYLAINVSSPNTPGLRALQQPERLVELIDAVHEVAPSRPIAVKLSPGLWAADLDPLVAAIATSSARGAILSNTTTERTGLRSSPTGEAGGLSGRPLRERTHEAVVRARGIAGDRLSIIASGGIGSAADATAMRTAGADAVQLWTGMIYAGPGLIGETVRA